MGALTSTGDVIVETRAWRDRLFQSRAPQRLDPLPPFWRGLNERLNGFMMPGGMMGGEEAAHERRLVDPVHLNQ